MFKIDEPIFIAGPCVIENKELLDITAKELCRLRDKFNIQLVFKASFDKANRTSIKSFRGPGIEAGVEMLAHIKKNYNLPITTDIHEPHHAVKVAEVVDIIQIPAFLCRQTDILIAAAASGKIVNIKKAPFLSADDMKYPVEKIIENKGSEVWLTERGNMYGYNNLIVDFRNVTDMTKITNRVIMDCTHAVQRPGDNKGTTGGNRKFIPAMALAAKAFGANGYFFEVHPNPEYALCDGPNMLYLKELETVIKSLL